MKSERRRDQGERASVVGGARERDGGRPVGVDTRVRSQGPEETCVEDSKVVRCHCNEGFRSTDLRRARPWCEKKFELAR